MRTWIGGAGGWYCRVAVCICTWPRVGMRVTTAGQGGATMQLQLLAGGEAWLVGPRMMVPWSTLPVLSPSPAPLLRPTAPHLAVFVP